jgi:CRP-like cAMP-binding protein
LRQYAWLARSKPILLLLIAWGLSYAGDLAAFTAASVYAYRAGGDGLVAILWLAKALPGALLVPLVTSGSDRVRRERLLIATVVPRALMIGGAAAAMTGGGQEGEPGERFYIIAEGRTRAARDGKQLREMSTGDSFGEIALLRRIPRTATVTAVSRVEVRFLVREEFLAAVTGTPESVESAKEVVSTRLESG